MADTPERHEPEQEAVDAATPQDRAKEPQPTRPSPDEIRQQVEDEDRFEATDN